MRCRFVRQTACEWAVAFVILVVLIAYRETVLPLLRDDVALISLLGTALVLLAWLRWSKKRFEASLLAERNSKESAENASRALFEGERKFRQLLETIPQIVLTLSPKGEIEYFNRRWLEYVGFDNPQIGSNPLDRVHPDDREITELLLERVFQSERSFEARFRLQRVDGSYRWHLGRALPLRDSSGIAQWIFVCTDIHDQKSFSDEIERKQEELNRALRIGRMATWEYDLRTKVVQRSEMHDLLYGFEGAMRDRKLRDFVGRIHPQDQQSILNFLGRLVSDSGHSYSIDFRVLLPGGNVRWLNSRIEVERDPNGRALKVRGALIDVQSMKEAETELKIAMEAAEEANRAKSQFIANISHEIRTPLGVILGFTELLKLEESFADSESLDHVDRIWSSAHQLAKLIDEVLDLSKVEADRLDLEISPFDPETLIKDVIASFDRSAQEKGLELKVAWMTPPPYFMESDPNRLRQILNNLIGNAIKFTDRGTVAIDMRLRRQNDRLVFSAEVNDTGIGISTSHQSRLFQPFSQADCSIMRRYGGTGLGLALSKKLAKALGGDVVLQSSAPGHGSCFVLTVDGGVSAQLMSPLHAEKSDDLCGREAYSLLRGVRVLLVDDSPDNQVLVSRFLAAVGVEVRTATNGKEAIDMIGERKFDVILMDLQMPVMDGYRAVQELRRSGYLEPVLALTAHAMKGEREKCLAAGFDDYLVKPVNRGELIRSVADFVVADDSIESWSDVEVQNVSTSMPALL